jgi:hypothetical protein
VESVTGNHKIDFVLSVLGALVPVFSALASFVNHWIRLQTNEGKQPSGVLLATGSLLNVASVNLDKGVQFAKMAAGKEVPQTSAAPQPPAIPSANPPEGG